MLKYVTTLNEQGRLVIPQIARVALGIEIGSLVEIEWEVDELDRPTAFIRPVSRSCEICGGSRNLQTVKDTNKNICGACKTELLSKFAEGDK